MAANEPEKEGRADWGCDVAGMQATQTRPVCGPCGVTWDAAGTRVLMNDPGPDRPLPITTGSF